MSSFELAKPLKYVKLVYLWVCEKIISVENSFWTVFRDSQNKNPRDRQTHTYLHSTQSFRNGTQHPRHRGFSICIKCTAYDQSASKRHAQTYVFTPYRKKCVAFIHILSQSFQNMQLCCHFLGSLTNHSHTESLMHSKQTFMPGAVAGWVLIKLLKEYESG